MKKLKDQLKMIKKSLVSLSKQVEKVAQQIDKLDSAKAPKKAAAKKKAVKKVAKAAKTVKVTKAAATKTVKKAAAPKKKSDAKEPAKKAEASGKNTVLDMVFDVVKKSRGGATIAKLKEKTSLDSRQLSNALYKLSKRGKIEAKSRGLYVKK